MLILAAGIVLRFVFCAGNDVRHVHDDHWHVVKIIVEEHHLPHPTEGWECYQPPLYYLIGAGVYGIVQPTAKAAGLGEARAHAAGRKAIQFVSAVSGSLTLVFVWLILRELLAGRYAAQALGMASAAFLPRHVYMSGMATNDALAYLWMTASVWALLRWCRSGWSARWALTAGGACGLALLTKQYGLATLGVLVLSVCLSFIVRTGVKEMAPSARRKIGSGATMLALALLLGVWPYWRNYSLHGSPLVSNYDLLPHAIWHQPPRRLGDVSFLSLRLASLLDHPWVHVSTLDSFWTELYARTWFDYGTTLTLFHYRPFAAHISRVWSDETKSPAERFDEQLTWPSSAVPASELAEGRALIAFGLIPAGLLVVGFFVALGRAWHSFPAGVLAANLLANLAIPIYQTSQQPHYSSMKATFCMGLLASAAAFCAWGADRVGWGERRWLRALIGANVVALAVVLAWHLVHIAYFPPEYFIAGNDVL